MILISEKEFTQATGEDLFSYVSEEDQRFVMNIKSEEKELLYNKIDLLISFSSGEIANKLYFRSNRKELLDGTVLNAFYNYCLFNS